MAIIKPELMSSEYSGEVEEQDAPSFPQVLSSSGSGPGLQISNKVTYKPIKPINNAVGKKLSDSLAVTLCIEEKRGEKVSQEELLSSIGDYLYKSLSEAMDRRSDRDEMIRSYEATNTLQPTDMTAFTEDEGASLRTPLTFKNRQTIHAWIDEAIAGIIPYVRVEPMPGGDRSVAAKIEQYYSTMYTEYLKFDAIADDLVLKSLDHGVAFLKPCWKRLVTNAYDASVLDESNYWEFGFKKEGDFYIGPEGERKKPGDMYIGDRTMVLTDGPSLEVVSYFDTIISPVNSPDIESARIVAQRKVVDLNDLLEGVRNGEYDEDAVEQIVFGDMDNDKDMSRCFIPITTMTPTHLNTTVTEPSANYEIGGDTSEEHNRKGTARLAEIVECFVEIDIDGDNISEKWFIEMETSTRIIYRCQKYVGHPTMWPMRPVVMFPRDGSIYGQPLGQILEGCQDEYDTAVQIRLDAGILANTAIVEEDRTARSGLTSAKLGPGINHFQVDRSDGKSAFDVHTLAPTTSNEILPNMQLMEKFAADVTGVNETLVGNPSNDVNTATEANQTVISGARRMRVLVKRAQRAIGEAHDIIHSMMRLYLVMRTGGNTNAIIPFVTEAGQKRLESTISLGQILTPVRFFMHGDGINTDEGLKLQAAEKVVLMAERSPFMSNSLRKRWEAEAYFLRAYGISDPQVFIGTQEEAEQKDQESAQQAQNPWMNTISPLLEPNVNEQYFTAWLGANQEIAQTVLQIMQSMSSIKASEKPGADAQMAVQQEKMNSQAEKQKLELKQQMDYQQQEMEFEKRVMQLELELEKVKQEYEIKSAQDRIANSMESQHNEEKHSLEVERLKSANSTQTRKKASS